MSSRDERRRRAADRLPPPNRVPHGLEDCPVLRIEDYRVGSWCPTPDGSGPAEAVALHLRCLFSDGTRIEFALRLKTPGAVDTLIASLERHRNDVWPGG